jgi:quercetin dioxygenase-like cupin family protein
VDGAVRELNTNDLVSVPPMAWHQFRATRNEPLGFLCMVNSTRDKPQLPTAEQFAALQRDPTIAAFLRGKPS